MSEIKFYKFATLALLIINLIVLSVIFFGHRPPPHGGPRPLNGSLPHEILDFTKDQSEKFERLASEHIEKVEVIDKAQRKDLIQYFSLLTKKSQINTDSLISSINNLEKEKIVSTYQHLEDVKSILDSNQKKQFGIFVEHIMTNVIGDNREKPPGPKK